MPDYILNDSNGLSNSKLALANAGTGDVRSGKTFYAGDKNLKTGTLIPATGTIEYIKHQNWDTAAMSFSYTASAGSGYKSLFVFYDEGDGDMQDSWSSTSGSKQEVQCSYNNPSSGVWEERGKIILFKNITLPCTIRGSTSNWTWAQGIWLFGVK